jgi:hypothetical protein
MVAAQQRRLLIDGWLIGGGGFATPRRVKVSITGRSPLFRAVVVHRPRSSAVAAGSNGNGDDDSVPSTKIVALETTNDSVETESGEPKTKSDNVRLSCTKPLFSNSKMGLVCLTCSFKLKNLARLSHHPKGKVPTSTTNYGIMGSRRRRYQAPQQGKFL